MMEETKKNFENNLNEKLIFSKEFNLNNKKKNPYGSIKTETQPKPTREKIVLTEDNDIDVGMQWMEIAREMNRSLLPAFIDHLMDGYCHTYNSYVYACTACAVATAYACGKDLSGFQASAITVMFPLYFYYYNAKTSIKIINYDDMLYPQYEYKYDKTISPATWAILQKTAADYIAVAKDEGIVRYDVLKHWQSIVDGVVPFGYMVEEDD